MGVPPTVLPVVFAVAAALLALWLDARLPHLRPVRARAYVLHLAASILSIEVAALVVNHAGSSQHSVLVVSLFAAFLPALVYAFVTSVWLLRVLLDLRG